MLREDLPQIRVRMVNVIDLMVLDVCCEHPHALDETEFNSLFTEDKPVVFNFHGYPSVVRQLLFGRKNTERFRVVSITE